MQTAGNENCHVILRGGTSGPNADAASVQAIVDKLAERTDRPRLMIDASHANSGKDHVRQAEVARDVAKQIAEGNEHIAGVMLESFLVAGAQALDQANPGDLVYGQSVTDACMDIDTTVDLLSELAAAVRTRRAGQTLD